MGIPHIHTMWGPQDISWLTKALVTIVINTINHSSYWTYNKPTWLSWGPHIVSTLEPWTSVVTNDFLRKPTAFPQLFHTSRNRPSSEEAARAPLREEGQKPETSPGRTPHREFVTGQKIALVPLSTMNECAWKTSFNPWKWANCGIPVTCQILQWI